MANSTPEPPPPPSQPTPPPPSPANPLQNRSVLIGLVAALLGVLMLSCCCCGGFALFSRSLGSGLGAGSSRLVGTWKGQDIAGFGINYTIDLKSNGRYEVEFEGRFVGSGSTTGKWRVKLIEDERYILDTVDDNVPDETIGWTVIFEESDQILMHQPNGDSWRLKRQ